MAPLQADWAAALSCWEAMGAEERRARQQLLSQTPGYTGVEHRDYPIALAYIREITSMVRFGFVCSGLVNPRMYDASSTP